VQNSKLLAGLVFVCMWFVTTAGALVFDLTDGSKVEGEIILAKPDGLQIRMEGNKYEKLDWSKFSQATLNELKKDKKLAPYVEPYIEVPLNEKIKKTDKAATTTGSTTSSQKKNTTTTSSSGFSKGSSGGSGSSGFSKGSGSSRNICHCSGCVCNALGCGAWLYCSRLERAQLLARLNLTIL
jgi:uncharacterized membrane protein YgcG